MSSYYTSHKWTKPLVLSGTGGFFVYKDALLRYIAFTNAKKCTHKNATR